MLIIKWCGDECEDYINTKGNQVVLPTNSPDTLKRVFYHLYSNLFGRQEMDASNPFADPDQNGPIK
jgi:hypothetical protein